MRNGIEITIIAICLIGMVAISARAIPVEKRVSAEQQARVRAVAADGHLPLVHRLTSLRHAHPDLFDAPVVWHSVSEPDKAYAFSRPLPDGTTFTLSVNISDKPVSFALPDGRRVALEPHGFDLHESVSLAN